MCYIGSLTVFLTLLGFTTSGFAIPITPAAPDAQLLAEVLRAEGVSEVDIASYFQLPDVSMDAEALMSERAILGSFGPAHFKRDASGDISPTSLEAPEMLPRSAAPETLTDMIMRTITGVLQGNHEKREFAYEGKESEMRRPQGMRYWGYE